MQFTDPNSGQPHWCHPDGRSFCSSLEEDDEHPAAFAPACVLYFGTFPEPVFLPTYSSSIAALAPVASAAPHAAGQAAGVIEQNAAVCDAGSCYLPAVCRTRESFAAAERWFGQNQMSRVSGSRRLQFCNAVDAFARGVIDRDAYESLAVSALCLRRWSGFVDQRSVVNAGELARDLCVGVSEEIGRAHV